jgi:two-component system cell cycle sensor histidine kinase/response regulator CckA
MKKTQILIVEDERIVATDIKTSLIRLGYDVCDIAVSGKEAIKKAEEIRPDLVLMDIVLEGEMDGIEAASIISSRFDLPIVYLTAHADDKTLHRAKMTGPSGYILKPFEDRDVHSTVEMALYKHKMGIKLKKSEKKFRTLTENINVGIYRAIPDAKGNFIEANPAIVNMFGYKNREEFLSLNVVDLYRNPEDREKFKAKISKNGFVKDEEQKFKRKDGTNFTGSVSAVAVKDEKGKVIYHDSIIEDITERKRAEEEIRKAKDKAEKAIKELKNVQARLVQSERLAALGELSAGVAHEINNPLNIITGHAQILLMEENLDSEVKETLEIIKKQVDRASKITNRLLHFSKRTKPEIRVMDVNENVNNTLTLLEHQLKIDNVEILKKLHSKAISIYGDPAQLQQVFFNLITNASHAMPTGGTLTICTKVKDTMAEISFTDTGCGIPKENLSKLFEPFFTTKEKGAGLGLSIVYGIIEAHRGSIKADSKVGKGTTFTITLPRLA